MSGAEILFSGHFGRDGCAVARVYLKCVQKKDKRAAREGIVKEAQEGLELEWRLRPLWEEGGKGKQRRWSWPVVMDRLRSIRAVGLWREERFLGYKMIRATPQQQRILDLAGVPLPSLHGRFVRT